MKLFLIIFSLFAGIICTAQNSIDFTRANFSDDMKNLKSAKKSFAKADILFDAGNYEKAKDYYLQAYNFNPKNDILNYRLGLAYFFLNNNDSASIFFKEAYLVNPKVDTEIEYYLGRTHQYMNSFDDAISYFQKYKATNEELENPNYENPEKLIQECKTAKIIVKDTVKIEISSMSNAVNSKFPDYSAYSLPNDSMIFFTSERSSSNNQTVLSVSEDIYFTSPENEDFKDAKLLGRKINTVANEAVVGLSPDGSKMFMFVDNNEGDIFYSEFVSGEWNKPLAFLPPVNTVSAEVSFCLSDDGKTAFLVSDREGTLGNLDIFEGAIDENMNIDTLINIGSKINTPYDENAVFMKNDTLYFSSKGHNTMGGYDIFKTYKTETGEWAEPVNLGFPINSSGDDLYYSKTSTKAFLSSDRNGSKSLDIFMIELIVKKPDTLSVDTTGIVAEIKEPVVSSLKGIDKYVTIENISFEINTSENSKAYPVLDKLVTYLKENPDAVIEINGYTDLQGNKGYNEKLASKRAEFVKNYMLSKGVDSKSFSATGKGFEKQISKNKDEKGKFIFESLKYNRRVEFNVVKQGKNALLVVNQIDVPEKYALQIEKATYFSVLLQVSDKKLDVNTFEIKGVKEYIDSEGIYNYYYGDFQTPEEADKYIETIKTKYPESFSFLNDFKL